MQPLRRHSDGLGRYLPELFEGREHGVDGRLQGFDQLGGYFPQSVGQLLEGFAGLLHLLTIGERHAAVVDVGAQLVIAAVGQTLAEREAGSFGSLAALLEGVPALRDFAIVREAVAAAFVVPADPGGDLVDGHVLTEVAAVVAVDDDGVRVCLQDPDGVVEVVGLPLAVPDVAPDRQGVPRAAGAIHDCPADAVADLCGEVSGDVSQCCLAGASSLVMCTTVTRASISCVVVYVSRSSSPMCRSSVSGPSSRKAVTATAFSR